MADLPQAESHAFPHLMIGASSPLWAYFGTAAAGGVAYWWATRWARPVNLEALLAAAEPVATPMLAATLAVAEAPLEVAEATAEIAVAQAHAAAAQAAPEPEPVIETTPETAAEAAPEPEPAVAAEAPRVAAEPPSQPEPPPVVSPKARARKAAASEPGEA